jgi:hypothetical protein
MRRVLALLLLLPLTTACWAADEGGLNQLTPKEAAQGWLLLFDGETTFGWDPAGQPKVQEGALSFSGDETVQAATTTAFRDYEVTFEYRIARGSKDARPVKLLRDADTSFPLTVYDDWAQAVFTFNGGQTTGSVTFKDLGKDAFAQASVGSKVESRHLAFEVPRGVKLSLRNVRLQPRSTTPLFNGKDLEGWKEVPGKKSKFNVTNEGWLSIKDGPGDLQTENQWADFVLQLECRINGDRLNSGVFFRCIPGQYQQGYEAQIQNGLAKESKTYTVEEYDPKTHELKDKKKVENWSADYGTGAIYRRVPARRPVARDREWFTLTVAAQGRHIATWVDGIQVVDWTDNRPDKDNARNGCRLEKGTISLQGHDPTTDLSFRNIRIADLAPRN